MKLGIIKPLSPEVVSIDNINDYYDVYLKYGRLNELGIDATKLEAQLGWKADKNFDSGIVKTVERYYSIISDTFPARK